MKYNLFQNIKVFLGIEKDLPSISQTIVTLSRHSYINKLKLE